MMVITNNFIKVSDDINKVKTLLPFSGIIILFLAILSIASIKNIEETAKERIKNDLTKSNFQQIETLLQILGSAKHEFIRHLQTLQALIYLDRNTEAIRYIEGISGNCGDSEFILFDGNPIITGLINSKSNLAQSQGIDFAVSPIGQMPNFVIEPWDLCSILGNLIDNAMEAALQDKFGPRVGVEFKRECGNYTIYVHNNGAKIKEEDHDKIFEAGFTDKSSPGRGYGLFITKNLVSQYGGTIELYTNNKTTFVVKLPEKGEGSTT